MRAVVLSPAPVEPDKFRAVDDPDLTKSNTGYDPESRRGVAFLWDLGDTDDNGKPAVRYAKLTTGHDKRRKRFYAELRNVVRAGGYGDGAFGELTVDEIRAGRYVMESTSLFDSVTVFTEPVGRYSAKAQATFDDRALAALRVAVLDRHSDLVTQEQRGKVLAFFDESLDGSAAEVIDLHDEDTLSGLQAAVGGYIEAVEFAEGYIAYVSEDAKILSPPLPRNPVATAIWEEALAEGGYSHLPGDYIAGPLVIVGPLTDEGETTGLTAGALSALVALLHDHGVERITPLVSA